MMRLSDDVTLEGAACGLQAVIGHLSIVVSACPASETVAEEASFRCLLYYSTNIEGRVACDAGRSRWVGTIPRDSA